MGAAARRRGGAGGRLQPCHGTAPRGAGTGAQLHRCGGDAVGLKVTAGGLAGSCRPIAAAGPSVVCVSKVPKAEICRTAAIGWPGVPMQSLKAGFAAWVWFKHTHRICHDHRHDIRLTQHATIQPRNSSKSPSEMPSPQAAPWRHGQTTGDRAGHTNARPARPWNQKVNDDHASTSTPSARSRQSAAKGWLVLEQLSRWNI